jgi:Flp pilus assembly protein TadD/uncharacterized membrane protein YidH (DUF202 family)
MIEWLRLLLMIFYAPLRGLREVRDRGSLAPIAFLAFLSQLVYDFAAQTFGGKPAIAFTSGLGSELFLTAQTIVLVALVLVPVLTLVGNLFERRGSFRVVLTQEYGPVAATMFYVLIAANLWAIVIAAFFHYSGIQAAHVASTMQSAEQIRAMFGSSPQFDAIIAQQLADPVAISEGLFRFPKLVLFCFWIVLAVKEAFRFNIGRAIAVTFVSCLAVVITSPLWVMLFSTVLGSPFLLIMLFLLFRGFFSDFLGQHRAKAAFKRNLEIATLNPADASAHYNLGLIHQQRGELDEARQRFERAVQIDPEEIDAHYQLGRIARQQKRYGDAIKHFEPVVLNDPTHSQHEIWREVAATYVAAEQFADARDALERYLEHRPSDPEGLYLMGRAHAGLGHRREATNLMQACIEAVKTAPAYKYRTSKRWMNEAQQFIKNEQ